MMQNINVNYSILIQISNIMNQSEFLIKYGILERAKLLLQSGMSEDKVSYQLKKLISRDEMGILFKVLFTT